MLTVRDLAHARAGDKGRSVNISVIAYDEAGYERLLRELTEARVAAAFAALADGPVRRYALPGLGAFNFVIERVQGGGVTATGALDIHGKSLSSLMLTIPLPGNEPAAGKRLRPAARARWTRDAEAPATGRLPRQRVSPPYRSRS